MKKLIILSIAIISFSAGFAQDRGKSGYLKDNNDHGYSTQTEKYRNQSYTNDHRYNGNDQRMNERERQAAIAKANSNHRYDQKTINYRNGRNDYPNKTVVIHETQRNRQQPTNSLGKAVIAGAVAGLIVGAIFSH